jgi:c-di-GMP-binding flagellar brake protein YcgR
MEPSDRRIGFRVDLDLFLTQFIRDRPFRVLSSNLSETGVYLHRVALGPDEPALPAGTVVGIELQLPGTGETIWARGEVRRERVARSVCGSGVRFAEMPRVHARMVRDFVHEQRRGHLATLLGRIRERHLAPRTIPPAT